jgi:mRNA interferase RelE/StbE
MSVIIVHAEDPQEPHRLSACWRARIASRVRTGDYRIVSDVLDDRLVVQVVRMGRRREAYRG